MALAALVVVTGCQRAAPSLTVSPQALEFGNVAIGTTASLDVTVANAGSAPLEVTGVGEPGEPAFEVEHACGALPPGASCVVTYRFDPTVDGPRSSSSAIDTSAGSVTVTLAGTGVTLAAEADPATLAFGLVPVGATAGPQTVTLRNTGTVPLTSITVGAPTSAAFDVSTACAAPLEPGASCTLLVSFAPSATAHVEASAMIETDAGPIDLALSGSGVASFSVSPLDLDFGDVGVGQTSAVQTVTIRNHGATTLGGFAGGAPSDPQFGAGQNCAGGVPPGGNCQYSFTFTPTAEGEVRGTSSSATAAGPFAIGLRGTGVGPRLWVTPAALDFGPVQVGAVSPTQVVTIANAGMATLAGFAGGAPSDPQFGAGQNCAGGVPPGGSCQYSFSFTPVAAGEVRGTSTTSTNAGGFTVDLLATGVTTPPTGPAVSASPLELDFGHVGVGQTSAVLAVTIRNPGDATLGGFAGGAPSDPQFGAGQNCAGGVPPGGNCQYSFTFTPTAEGEVRGTSSSATAAGPFAIGLRGTGVGPRLWVTPLELDFGTVPVGETSAPQVVTITNVGMATLASFAGGAPTDPQFGASQNCAGGVVPGASCSYTFSFTPSAPGVYEATSSSNTNAGGIVVRLRGNTPVP